VTWGESVQLPVLTFDAVVAIAALISHFEQTTEKDEKWREGTHMGIVWTVLAIIGLIVVITWIL
jgi:heme/copper-type cytochrome/quinol oxidase subunit 2